MTTVKTYNSIGMLPLVYLSKKKHENIFTRQFWSWI